MKEDKNTRIDSAKYVRKLRGDAGVVVLLLIIMYFSEIFILYKTITTLWGKIPELSVILPLYIIFLILLLSIETIGCLRVYNSIKEHMYSFNYYD
ncbi:monomethylamine transporter [Methanococcoides sp. AM1]|uniref:monomethylamine transporter n=1 Tax=Methanococcoides sp. AM1 TaxID=1201011 RepID=UPI001082AA2F|nr:monomethylamine transporter [Methanococcoides sp. AM1]